MCKGDVCATVGHHVRVVSDEAIGKGSTDDAGPAKRWISY